MTRIVLLGIVAIAIFVIAPRVGATRSITVDPNQTSSKPDSGSPLFARTVFDVEDLEGEDVADRRDENVESGRVEERRDDANDWAEDN
jgi:hypothetical protein